MHYTIKIISNGLFSGSTVYLMDGDRELFSIPCRSFEIMFSHTLGFPEAKLNVVTGGIKKQEQIDLLLQHYCGDHSDWHDQRDIEIFLQISEITINGKKARDAN